MKIVDLNILLYAINPAFEYHKKILSWWENALNDEESLGLTWLVISGFVRISTNPRIFPKPLSIKNALLKVDKWLHHDTIVLVQETKDHWTIFRELVDAAGAAGNLCADAHLAAIAISQGATLVSCDSDFSRFKSLRWFNPMSM